MKKTIAILIAGLCVTASGQMSGGGVRTKGAVTQGNIPKIVNRTTIEDSGIPSAGVISTNAVTQTITDEADEIPSGAAVTAGLAGKVDLNGSNSVFNVANWVFTKDGTNYVKALSVDTNGLFIATTTEQ